MKEDISPKYQVEIFLKMDYKVLLNCMKLTQRLRLGCADEFIKQAIDNHIKLHKNKLN